MAEDLSISNNYFNCKVEAKKWELKMEDLHFKILVAFNVLAFLWHLFETIRHKRQINKLMNMVKEELSYVHMGTYAKEEKLRQKRLHHQ